MAHPLRILAVLNLPWDRRLGAARVWMELADQWRAAGHVVDKYCLTDAFPRESSWPALVAVRQLLFAYKAARYIRQNANRYDIIDCLLGTLPFSKKQLGFAGLLVGRSVGFYRAYEKFDLLARQRWPDQPKGKVSGRILYRFTTRRTLKAAAEGLRHVDLINLPNEDERVSLREDTGSKTPAIVQPYGLQPRVSQALQIAAAPADARQERKTISFIGMWSIRKGSRDWGEIVSLIRSEVREARFRFLGTMTEGSKVLADLGFPNDCDYVELVQEFEPEQLPNLLSDCCLGIFPSYVEGFGFGVIEQLAAGIPTLAYDVTGPRQILEPLRKELLTPAGETGALARKAVDILNLDLESYRSLRTKSLEIAARFSWPTIAEDTLRLYREALSTRNQPMVFTQPFGLRAIGGGARIMRALLEEAPTPFITVCTSPTRPPDSGGTKELHIPLRPYFGRVETTRLAGLPQKVAPLFAGRFMRELEQAAVTGRARAIHSVAHGGLDFLHSARVAGKLKLPFFLHIHDDFLYTARGVRNSQEAHEALREAWQTAAARFVICEALGEEYSHRYGRRDYTVVSDGLEQVVPREAEPPVRGLRIYFMGLFHLEYEENFRVLLEAVRRVQSGRGGEKLSITMRCGGVRQSVLRDSENFVTVMPFGSEADVQADLVEADLLYLPLPFVARSEPFVRFSLSTKLVTYIGSGRPVLYHGPGYAAAHDLLKEHDAALLTTGLEPEALAETLRRYLENKETGAHAARNALQLARDRFMLRDIRQRFWNRIASSLEPTEVEPDGGKSRLDKGKGPAV